MTSFNLKNIKLFSTEQEKAELEQKEHDKDSDFGNPKSELATMYNASRWGIHFIACVTLLSTMAFVYRVTFPHVTELIGETAAAISMLVLAFGLALAIEIMLRGNWEPFFKKLFVKAEVDLVLLFLGALFTTVVIAGALTGMEIISDEGAKAPEIESISATSASMSGIIETNKAEIATLSAGKGKGVYAWQGKPTPHAKNRIKELETQNTAAFSSITSLSTTTEKANAAKIETFTAKQAKAVRFLSRLAIGCEILKFVIFIFWGYRSYELKNYDPKPTTPQKPVATPIPVAPVKSIATPLPVVTAAPVVSPISGAKSDNAAKQVWRVKTNNRGPYKDKFKQHFLYGKFDYDKLVKYWQDNEDALFEACMEMGFEYTEMPAPKGEDFGVTA